MELGAGKIGASSVESVGLLVGSLLAEGFEVPWVAEENPRKENIVAQCVVEEIDDALECGWKTGQESGFDVRVDFGVSKVELEGTSGNSRHRTKARWPRESRGLCLQYRS